MINIINRLRGAYLVILCGIVFITSCNKELEQFTPIATPVYPTGNGIAATIAANANYSFYNALITRAGLAPSLNDLTKTFTLFATDNAGMKVFVNAASGGAVPLAAPDATFLGFISGSLPVASAQAIIQYNTIGQKFTSASFGSAFPNYPLPSQIVLDPSQPFVRMPIFPAKGTPYSYVNTIPITGADIAAANGVIIPTFTIVAPPQRVMWERINTDADLTIFKAAIARADSGTITAKEPLGVLVGALSNGGANFTVFAPTNLAMKQLLSALTGIPVAAPDANFIGFLASNFISTRLVKGIVVYHIFDGRSNTLSAAVITKRPGRVFTNNIPAADSVNRTLLSSADSIGITYPGVAISATYSGLLVIAAKVKGNVNPTASNIIINFTPDILPSYGSTPPASPITYVGTSDQNYVNGIIHKIDQVLRPQ